MTAAFKYLILPAFLLAGFYAAGQATFASYNTGTGEPNCKPPKNRELFHDFVDAQQKAILKSDGKTDQQYTPSSDEQINFLLTQAATSRIDAMQCRIESDTVLKDQDKVRYLRGLENVLRFFVTNTGSKKISPSILPDILSTYEKCMQYDEQGKSIEPIIGRLSYETGYSVVKAENNGLEKNAGFKRSREALVLKYCLLFPSKTLSTLRDNPDVPFADSMVRVVAKTYPRQLYDFAAANNKLGYVIRNITDDDFIKTIVKMARSKSGQQYFVFLDNIINGKMTIEEIDASKDDSVKYYKLMVKTMMEYTGRALNKDTAFEFNGLRDRLERKAKENFVNIINGLHTSSDLAVRFKVIQPLSAEELYYLAVAADDAIYTSSFVKGVYPLMMKKTNNHGDSLLMSLHFDKYRRFIKMAAGFNKLSDFLNSFPAKKDSTDESDAEKLMKAFVGKLEAGDGLEDGVNVADSYASIVETIKPLANEMLKNIQLNYDRNERSGNKRGMAMYKILNNLFLSADSSKHINLTEQLHIPPVYEVPFSSLANDSGRVIMQVFIYGDKDGIGVFPGILNLFSAANWKIDRSNDQWVTINSIKGKPVSVYLNRPLPEEKNEDAKAQEALCTYLEKNKLYPTVTINRGHSYNAPYTIEQMFSTSKIVFMGSCGGYRSIHDILEKAPDAHIIGTKQIADAPVNNPFLRVLAEKIREGSDIQWIPFWKQLAKEATDPIFADYVPPYKNLGALFIKAYKIAMNDSNVQ